MAIHLRSRCQGLLVAIILHLACASVHSNNATGSPQQLFIGALGTYYTAIHAATCLSTSYYGGCSAALNDNYYAFVIYDLIINAPPKGQQLKGTATLGCLYPRLSPFYMFERTNNAENSNFYKALNASEIVDIMTLAAANMSLIAEAACYTYAPCNTTYGSAGAREQAASSFVNSQIRLYNATLKRDKDTGEYCAVPYNNGVMSAFTFVFAENYEVGALGDWQLRLNNTVTEPQVNATQLHDQLTAVLPPGMQALEGWWLSAFFFNSSAYESVFASGDSPRSPTAVAVAAGTPAWLAGNMQNNTVKKAYGAAAAADNGCMVSTQEAVENAQSLLDDCTLITGEIATVMAGANLILKSSSPCSMVVAMLDQLFGQLEVGKQIQSVGSLTAAPLSKSIHETLSAACVLIPGTGEVELTDILLQLAVTTCNLANVGLEVYKQQEGCCYTACKSDFCSNYFGYSLTGGSGVVC